MPYDPEYWLALRSRFPDLTWSGEPDAGSHDTINVQQLNLGRTVRIHPGFNTTSEMHGIQNGINGKMPKPSILVNIHVVNPIMHWNEVVKRFETASECREERAFIGAPPFKCVLVKQLKRNIKNMEFQLSDPFIAECLDWHESRIKAMLALLKH